MKISIVGLGHVGSAAAHALAIQGIGSELLLVSRNQQRAEGDAIDLAQAVALLPHTTLVRAGTLADTVDSGLIVLTASCPVQHAARNAQAKSNGDLYRQLIPQVAAASPHGVLLVVTNPVDALTWLSIRTSGWPATRVLGCGTILDSARFRAALSRELRIHPDDVRAYVLGEHGDTQFAATSLALAGGVRIGTPELVTRVFAEAVASPYKVYHQKGYTNFAVAQAIAMIASAVERNELRTIPISTLLQGYLGLHDVCMSLPCVVGRGGIEQQLFPELNPDEQAACRRSAAAIKQTIAALG